MALFLTFLLSFSSLWLAEPDSVKPGSISSRAIQTSEVVGSFDPQKDALEAVKQIYEVYLGALVALSQNDQLETERLITASLELIQSIIEDSPEIQNNKRFQLLYRAVINEYNEFYGISEGSEESGDVFSVMAELFSEEPENAPVDFRIPENISIQKFQVPLTRNQYVNNHLFYLVHRRPEIFEKWLQRSEFYFPMMAKVFKEEGVPTELIHLSMIESGLVAHATSKAKAVGLWQFIVATGAMYGLEVNYWIDERRDPEKATRAAARHLRDLYNIWGDWHLSLANYNVSPRRMKWAISKSNGVKNYWVIYPYLPKETRGYVPSYIATTLIATNAEQFGFKKNYGGTPYQYEIAEIEGSIRLDVLARCAGISVDSLRFWNPELIRWATPPGKNPYPLKLPVGLKAQFEQRLGEISDTERKPVAVHIVKSGETLGRIAAKYGTTVKELYAVNPSLPPKLKNGQEIIIPVPPASATRITANMPSAASRTDVAQQQKNGISRPNSAHIVYTIKPGDTIASIANAHQVSAEDLRDWNNTDNKIKAGQKLVIYASQKGAATPSKQVSMQSKSGYTQYTVRSNDTLFEIARRFGMKVEELKRVNNLKNNTIQPGQVLYVSES